MSLSGASSLSRTEISSTVNEEGEDEEENEWLSCFIGVREDDDDPEEELDKPWDHDWNEVLRGYR